MSTPENPFAFPFPGERTPDGTGIYEGSLGMTLRDWFAGQALAGIMANPSEACDGAPSYAYFLADAMIAARVKL